MKAFINVDNTIDLITNSSSELFVLKADKQKQVIVDLINTAFLKANIDFSVTSDDI